MRRPRRVMAQMNVVPYIDVMLVLLVIFMVAAPMLQPGVVDLPTIGRAAQVKQEPLQVVVLASGLVEIRDTKGKVTAPNLTLNRLIEELKPQLNTQQPVVIAAEKTVQYDLVMKVMDTLQHAQIQRVGLLVKPIGEGRKPE